MVKSLSYIQHLGLPIYHRNTLPSVVINTILINLPVRPSLPQLQTLTWIKITVVVRPTGLACVFTRYPTVAPVFDVMFFTPRNCFMVVYITTHFNNKSVLNIQPQNCLPVDYSSQQAIFKTDVIMLVIMTTGCHCDQVRAFTVIFLKFINKILTLF